MIRRFLLLGFSVVSLVATGKDLLAQPNAATLSVDAQMAGVPAALLDSRASESARIAALKAVANDELGLVGRPALVERLRKTMIDREQPASFRLAIFGQLSVLFFSATHTPMPGKPPSTHDAQAAADSFNAEVRTLLDDPDARLQKSAFSWLSIFRDPEATKRAAEVLQGRRSAPLSTAEAIGVLTFFDPAPFLEVIHGAYRNTRDIDAREAALRVLGSYAPARSDLMAVARSPEEPIRLRKAALETLFAADREGFPRIAAPLLREQSRTSDEVAGLAIALMRGPRSQPPYRERKLKGYDDEFDRGVRGILARDSKLRNLAHLYLLDTDPTYRPAASR